jgi:ankyrin repeat protein
MKLDLERGLESLGWPPLMLAAYSSNPETVQALIEIGCNRGAVGDNGYSVFRAACDNAQMDLETLELLWHNGDGVDINESVQPRTAAWQAITTMSALAAKCGAAIPVVSGLAKAFADLHGSTPLHGAAKAGRLDIVQWLMHRGAAGSLHARTASGATPVRFAEHGGHYAVVSFLNGTKSAPRRAVAVGDYTGDYDA